MITGPEKFKIPSVIGLPVEIMCNWAEGIDGKYVKVRIGEGKWTIVQRHAFIRAAMFLANSEEQEELIPMQQMKVMELKKNYTVKVTKNLRAGDTITIPVRMQIPLTKGTTHIPVLGKGLTI